MRPFELAIVGHGRRKILIILVMVRILRIFFFFFCYYPYLVCHRSMGDTQLIQDSASIGLMNDCLLVRLIDWKVNGP